LASAEQWLNAYWNVVDKTLCELNERGGAEERVSLKLLVEQLCELWERETGRRVTAHGMSKLEYTQRTETDAGRFVTAGVEAILPEPRRETLGDLEKLKQSMGTLYFSAQYQQEPIPLEGNLIKREWFKELTYGPMAHLLKNRTYLGEIGHKGEWFDGEHAPIIDQATFDQVQQIMKANSVTRRHKRAGNGALLAGLVHDDHGNCMTPSFTTKRNVRYRFYVIAALLKGHKDQVGSLQRISGPDLEAVVLAALRDKKELALFQDASDDQEFINKLIERIEVGRSNIRLILKQPKRMPGSTVCLASGAYEGETLNAVDIAWQRNPHGPLAQVEESQARGNEPDPSLVQAVARAHAWAKLLTDGTHNSVDSLAASINMHPKVVRKKHSARISCT
jgi:hypothetical protein